MYGMILVYEVQGSLLKAVKLQEERERERFLTHEFISFSQFPRLHFISFPKLSEILRIGTPYSPLYHSEMFQNTWKRERIGTEDH